MTALRDLATAAGLDVDYTSWRGEPVAASDEAVWSTLRALAPGLGIELERPAQAGAAIVALEAQPWTEVVAPVVIGWDGTLEVPFAVRADADLAWEVEVATESGRTVRASGRLFELPADGHAWPGGVVHCRRRATIALDGEHGYHTVRWRIDGAGVRRDGEAFGISAPRKAWGAPGEGGRRWGVFAPVYGLADAATGPAGDLSTLARLRDAVERRGGRYVATLPILAQFLDEPCMFSPYSPASRLYWNEQFLDLAALGAEVGRSPATAPPIVDGAAIDYRAAYRWRRAELDQIAATLRDDPNAAAAVDGWAIDHGVYDYAAFRAIGEHHRTGWTSWPARDRDEVPWIGDRAGAAHAGADAARVWTHVVAQWAMQRQLDTFATRPAGLYLDLPVGVNCDAYEVWRHRSLFITALAAGAPPDPLFLGGQNWGLPPLAPRALQLDRHRYFIRCVRHHMAVASMLRVDHVMGLFRLYCVPEGRPATDGVYLRYPYDELFAILTLESHRQRCALVGEDLGTVPPHVRPAMARHGMFRIHVGQWFLPAHAGAPEPSPPDAVASLNTHDTATFGGWCQARDVDDRRELGLISDDQDRAERIERTAQLAALVSRAHAEPPVAVDEATAAELTDTERAMVRATADLAGGPAEVVLVALDDLVLDPQPHNVPGTTHERPNWQRRIERWADALDPERASPAAAAAFAVLTAARP